MQLGGYLIYINHYLTPTYIFRLLICFSKGTEDVPVKSVVSRVCVQFLVLFCVTLPVPAVGEIYKHQDDQGRWHFTDKPPPGVEVTENQQKEKTTLLNTDLSQQLLDKYQPVNPVQGASLSVVGIQTPMVSGSGFFVSADGYILTNKHIIKPAGIQAWKELERKYKLTREFYQKSNKSLRNKRARLTEIEKELDVLSEEIDRLDELYAKRLVRREYNMLRSEYVEIEKEYKVEKQNNSIIKRKYVDARREYNLKSGLAIIRKVFKTVLKDGTIINARLVGISDSHDLALLKMDGYNTPYLSPAITLPSQGEKVFAIGSPLEIKDVMTAGVISSIRDDLLISDATVLPGSSGGPLVDEAGEVVGVNSFVISTRYGSGDLGVAININTALEQFKKFLQ